MVDNKVYNSVTRTLLLSLLLQICETRIHFGSEGPEPSAKSSSNSSNSRGTSGSLLMDGMSSIEVDTGGLFLSVPVSTEVVSTGGAHPLSLDDQDSNEKRSRRILKKGASLFVINGKKVPKRLPNDNRMMLHIPASEGITVTCSQPASLIISIPLQRAASPYSSSKDRNRDRDRAGSSSTDASSLSSLREGSSKSGGTQSSHQDHADLGSAIAPWSYIQCHNEKAFDVTDDDKVEASDFARNLSSLERYIAGLPSHAVEVKICISCAHRLERDALVLAVRALAAQQPNATSERRRSALPWTESGLQQFPRPGDRCAVFGGTYDNASVTTDTTQSPSSHVLSPIASSLDSQQIRQLHDALAAHSEKEV